MLATGRTPDGLDVNSAASQLATRLNGLRSTIESKETRIAAMEERLARNREDLVGLERWRARLKSLRHADTQPTAEWHGSAADDVGDLLPPALHDDDPVDPREQRYASLLKEEAVRRRHRKRLELELAESSWVAAEETRAPAPIAAVAPSPSLSTMTALHLNEAAQRTALAAEARSHRSQLALAAQSATAGVSRRHRESLLAAQAELCDVLSREADATEALCEVARLTLSAVQQDARANEERSQRTLDDLEKALRDSHVRLERSPGRGTADAARPSGEAETVLSLPVAQLLQKATLAALNVTRSAHGSDAPAGSFTSSDPHGHFAALDRSFLQEVQLMLRACVPLVRSQGKAAASHTNRLEALLQAEWDGLQCSHAALESILREKKELSLLL